MHTNLFFDWEAISDPLRVKIKDSMSFQKEQLENNSGFPEQIAFWSSSDDLSSKSLTVWTVWSTSSDELESSK